MPRSTGLGRSYRTLFAATTISNLGDGVGTIAYPWLATAVTRNPFLIALIGVVQRLPWLLFTLPAGVITDRNDRRRLMVGANTIRAVLTAALGVAVLVRSGALPSPDAVDTVVGTDVFVYVTIVVATLLLGTCEVLHDNSAQTFLPALVDADDLEKANGRLYSAELIANQFVGPPLASLLLATGFVLPILFDAGSFAAAAGLVFSIVVTKRPSAPVADRADRPSWRADLSEGFRWLWGNELLRTFAITLGLINMLSQVTGAIFVLYGQEVLDTNVIEFAIMSTGAAIGGVLGGWLASTITKRLGPGVAVGLTLWVGGFASIATGFVSSWVLVGLLEVMIMFVAVLWNVITVSLRQAVIPDRLLGRVNSVYRFFGWGAIPIGGLIGGVLVAVLDGPLSREWALRTPWIVSGVAQLAIAAVVARTLTSERIEAARGAGQRTDAGAVDPAAR